MGKLGKISNGLEIMKEEWWSKKWKKCNETFVKMSRVIEKLLLFFGALFSASGSLRDGFGICEYGSLCYSPKQVPSKSQLSPIIFPQSCELDGRRMGEGWEMKGKERGKVNGKTQILGCLSVIVYVKKTIF